MLSQTCFFQPLFCWMASVLIFYCINISKYSYYIIDRYSNCYHFLILQKCSLKIEDRYFCIIYEMCYLQYISKNTIILPEKMYIYYYIYVSIYIYVHFFYIVGSFSYWSIKNIYIVWKIIFFYALFCKYFLLVYGLSFTVLFHKHSKFYCSWQFINLP